MGLEDAFLKKQLDEMATGGKIEIRKEMLQSLRELDAERDALEEKLEKATSEREREEIRMRLEGVEGLIDEFESLDRQAEDAADEMAEETA